MFHFHVIHRHEKLADVQREVLVPQLQLAVELKLPIVIHCRDADDELLELLQKVSILVSIYIQTTSHLV